MMNVFRSAITGTDGEVDAGYLALFWTMCVVLTAIPFMCAMTIWYGFDPKELGTGIGFVAGGFATVAGAIGMFRMGDKEPPGTTTTSQSSKSSVTKKD